MSSEAARRLQITRKSWSSVMYCLGVMVGTVEELDDVIAATEAIVPDEADYEFGQMIKEAKTRVSQVKEKLHKLVNEGAIRSSNHNLREQQKKALSGQSKRKLNIPSEV